MKTLIQNYQNIPGEHCGSTAMMNLIAHYCGLKLSEAEVIGLGSATDFIYIKSEQNQPKILTLGRSKSMEVDLTQALGIDYREIPDLDNAHAWEVVKQEVLAGRPTMLSGDTFYLDYRGFGGHHFPAHRFVLVGFDDERRKAIIADRIDSTFEESAYDALAASRNPPTPISTYNLWGKFHGTDVKRTMREACLFAMDRSVKRMLGIDKSPEMLLKAFTGKFQVKITTGIQGIRAFHEDFLSWKTDEDWKTTVKYTSDCFERYGTGGGNFRKMYANFLEKAQQHAPEVIDQKCILMTRNIAQEWTTLSGRLIQLTKKNSDHNWKKCHDKIGNILLQETALYQHLEQRLKHAR